MKFDLDILNRYIYEGWVEKSDHPTLPISIYNYSRNTQFEGKWDEITKQCRGLILDNEGNVVAKSFPKFFNMEEHNPEEIPNESFEVFEKLDGSLGILFHYGGEWNLATKGSFISDQSVKGLEIFKKQEEKYGSNLSIYNTYLCEIIYPENRIVVNYGNEEKLVLLGIMSNSGLELPYGHLIYEWHSPELIVKRYDGVNDYKILKELVKDNQEGFVIKFKPSRFRMKIKGEEYVRLHRLLTNFSNIDIWELLKNNEPLDKFLERVPDEFDLWVRNCVNELMSQYKKIELDAIEVKKNMIKSNNFFIPNRPQYAELVKNQLSHLRPILFALYDNKDHSQIIWKQIRPKYQKPFWNKKIDRQ